VAVAGVATYIAQQRQDKGAGKVRQEEAVVTLPEKLEIDTSNWKTYRNEQYGFEFRYPNTYSLINRDTEHSSIEQSRYIVLKHTSNATSLGDFVTIEVIDHQEPSESDFHLGMTNLQYVSYIKEQQKHQKAASVMIENEVVLVSFFQGENPGEFGDFQDTAVIVIDRDRVTFVIKCTPASSLERLQKILSTLSLVRH
jgi:hypothetical protein